MSTRHSLTIPRAAFALLLLLGNLLPMQPIPAQVPPSSPDGARGDTLAARRLQVSLLTFGQGTPVFERFGHNAIRIADPLIGLDISWNWGMFSFDEPNFLGRFLSGTSRYWVEGFGTVPLLAYYQENDRHTVEQQLNLSGAQKLELLRFVRWNELEENKFYPYDYFRDNCSTRVRDALDRVLGGALKLAWADSLSAHSFRSEALRLTEGAPFSRLGIDIALGTPADRRMTAWEEMYVPMRLRDRIRGIMVPGPDGAPVSLVKSERVIFSSVRDPEAAAPAVLPGLYVIVALAALVPLALFGGLAFLSALRGRWPGAQRSSRVVIAVIAAVWYASTGVIGLAVAFMELFSKHVFWYGNWNVLLLSPLGLAAAWFVPRAVVGGRDARAARWLSGLCGVSALVALAVSVSGAIGQSTGAVVVAFTPATMYLALLVPALTLIRPVRT
ncbi:MAG: lipoprotein N-acyltransferase Lnb domain-containing protein [Gemmatimonadaceae bacterium]